MPVLSGYRNTSMQTDINCDMGEGIGNDEQIMPYITSANIACGYHAGDVDIMQQTIDYCIRYKITIGAHPSFYDRENFGRSELHLPPHELYEIVTQQLLIINEMVNATGEKLIHVKPHGALYNLSAKDKPTANIIARAIKDFDHALILVGLSGSHSISEAKATGLKTYSEVFADRTYQNDGSLTPRSESNALIENTEQAVNQVLQMINEGTVKTVSGNIIPVVAETVCIHGDGKHAVTFAEAIYKALKV